MTDPIIQLNAVLDGRYPIESELSAGGHHEGKRPIRLRTGVRPTDREPDYGN